MGKVQEVKDNYVIVQRGTIDKEKFYIPKDQAESYDGDVLRFRISKEDLDQYQHEPPSTWDSDSAQETTTYERDTTEEEIIRSYQYAKKLNLNFEVLSYEKSVFKLFP